MPLNIVHEDITKIKCDVIINPTDEEFSGSGGADYQIHLAAGPSLDAECDKLPILQIGGTAVTSAYDLPCKKIIHTTGPIWNGGDECEEILLRSCYLNSLIAASKINAGSIAFPLISSGTFGFPKDMVLDIALEAIGDFFDICSDEPDVFLCVWDKESYELSKKIRLEDYLNAESVKAPEKKSTELSEWIRNHDDNFAVTLLKLIDKKGMTDVECYKKSNISRKTFSKINNDPKYRPSKQTVIAFSIGLGLTYEETEQLLRTVGFSLSRSDTFDIIIEYFITNGIYDIFTINAALYKYDQQTLGC